MDIEIVCNKCGKAQEKDEKQSNKNWSVYPTGNCECGGKYKPKRKK